MKFRRDGEFPTTSGILLGLGLGGFFDGIVLHQLLQWHHMLSSWYPMNTSQNIRLNTLWDGIFHSATYVFVVVAIYLIWRTGQRGYLYWSGKLLLGSILCGWGAFNVVEGLIDHELLGIHHVNETAPIHQWFFWDLGFLVWGVLMIALGLRLYKAGKRYQNLRSLNYGTHLT